MGSRFPHKGHSVHSVHGACRSVLLDAHDLIIRSYWAQKHCEEDGLAAAVGQQTRVHYNVTI